MWGPPKSQSWKLGTLNIWTWNHRYIAQKPSKGVVRPSLTDYLLIPFISLSSRNPSPLQLPTTVFTASFSSGLICLTALRGMTYLPWMLLRQRFYYDVEYNASGANSRFLVTIFIKWNISTRKENLAHKLCNLKLKQCWFIYFDRS